MLEPDRNFHHGLLVRKGVSKTRLLKKEKKEKMSVCRDGLFFRLTLSFVWKGSTHPDYSTLGYDFRIAINAERTRVSALRLLIVLTLLGNMEVKVTKLSGLISVVF